MRVEVSGEEGRDGGADEETWITHDSCGQAQKLWRGCESTRFWLSREGLHTFKKLYTDICPDPSAT